MGILLTWNGQRQTYEAEDYERHILETGEGREVQGTWGVRAQRGGVPFGESAYLLRQRNARGLLARGRVVEYVAAGELGETTAQVRVAWERVLPLAERLPIEDLIEQVDEFDWNSVFFSGRMLDHATSESIDSLWQRHLEQLLDEAQREALPPQGRGPVARPAQREAGLDIIIDAHLKAIYRFFGQDAQFEIVASSEDDDRPPYVSIRIRDAEGGDAAWERLLGAQEILLGQEADLRFRTKRRHPLNAVGLALRAPGDDLDALRLQLEGDAP